MVEASCEPCQDVCPVKEILIWENSCSNGASRNRSSSQLTPVAMAPHSPSPVPQKKLNPFQAGVSPEHVTCSGCGGRPVSCCYSGGVCVCARACVCVALPLGGLLFGVALTNTQKAGFTTPSSKDDEPRTRTQQGLKKGGCLAIHGILHEIWPTAGLGILFPGSWHPPSGSAAVEPGVPGAENCF